MSRTRVHKTPIANGAVLNEAYDYARKASFVRGMRVQIGDAVLLLISGTASVGPNGESLHTGDLRRQARRTFDNIKALLANEAADWHDVVRTTVYLADMRDYDLFNEVRNAFYREEALNPFPASTCVEARLCRPELLVEIEAMAVIPASRRA